MAVATPVVRAAAAAQMAEAVEVVVPAAEAEVTNL